MAEIPVKRGKNIPLSAQETNLDATKVVRAQLYNMATMAPIGGLVGIPHVASGLYQDNTQLFPVLAVDKVLAQYFIFDAGGIIPNTTGDQAVVDIFYADDLQDAQAVRLDFGEITIQAEADGEVDMVVEDADVTADVESDIQVDVQLDEDEVTQVTESDNIQIEAED